MRTAREEIAKAKELVQARISADALSHRASVECFVLDPVSERYHQVIIGRAKNLFIDYCHSFNICPGVCIGTVGKVDGTMGADIGGKEQEIKRSKISVNRVGQMILNDVFAERG